MRQKDQDVLGLLRQPSLSVSSNSIDSQVRTKPYENILSQMLLFDPEIRITAADAFVQFTQLAEVKFGDISSTG